jgi:hypothetical protein
MILLAVRSVGTPSMAPSLGALATMVPHVTQALAFRSRTSRQLGFEHRAWLRQFGQKLPRAATGDSHDGQLAVCMSVSYRAMNVARRRRA